MTETITSIRNPLLQNIRRALQRGEPTPDKLVAIEGRHLLEEALKSPALVEVVLAPSFWEGYTGDARRIQVSDALLAQVASTETSPGVIALVRFAPMRRLGELAVVLDGIQDPGNAGTILRSAEAFGACGAVFPPGTVSPYNPKAMRASAGSIFRMAIAPALPEDFHLYAADAHEGASPREVDWRRPCAIAVGSEARGLSPAIRERATLVRIPTVRVESLNAAVSASILLYEASLRPLPELYEASRR
ncbi:MAG: RNA methyltransferase [Bryobacteraceae bacterium]|nr:RNA methyltransferase [Bryobacteraceae bacterium]